MKNDSQAKLENVPGAKVVLAYSGGLDTSVMISILREHYGYEVIACHIDVGEAPNEELLRKRALQAGACEVHFIAGRKCLADDFIVPAIQANALYQNQYPLSAALSRPLIIQKLLEVAEKCSARAVAHGATGKGNDQVRFDLAARALAPEIQIIAPQREHNMTRDAAILYAAERDIEVPVTVASPYSIDENLWGRSIEGGVIEELDKAPPTNAWKWTLDPSEAPDQPQDVKIRFFNGVPVAVDGNEMSTLDVIENLHAIACSHGVGRIDMLENRVIGIKTRELYEAPAATLLIDAHRDLESAVLDRNLGQFKQQIDQAMTKVIYDGLWFSPLRESLQTFIHHVQQFVTGEVTMRLYKGRAAVVARKSENILYDHAQSTYGVHDAFDHRAAEGWIELEGLPIKLFRTMHPVS